ncbi:flagellar assembly protein FliW, partial [Paenibacillus sp. MCAF20]
FNGGIPGFKSNKSYIVVEMEEGPFKFLQSIDEAGLSFIIVSPFDFFKEYEFELSEQLKSDLAIETEQQVAVYSIVSIRDELVNATVNLTAPIIINKDSRTAVQYIISNDNYSIRQPLFSELLVAAGKGD